MYKIKKGLDIPITGQASGEVERVKTQQVAILGPDYVGMKPTMMVQVGDIVKCGQKLFEDKKNPGVFFTAPIAGKVSAVHRGAKRMLLSVVIDREGDEAVDESGLWTSIRTRPYSKTAKIDSKPHSVFVNAMDTNPLAIDPEMVVAKDATAFEEGLKAVSKLTDGTTFVCKRVGAEIAIGSANVQVEEFDGPHPAGLVGMLLLLDVCL